MTQQRPARIQRTPRAPTFLYHGSITQISHSDPILESNKRQQKSDKLSSLSNRDKNLPKENIFFHRIEQNLSGGTETDPIPQT